MPILVDIASLFEMLVWCCRNVVLVKLIKVFFFFMAALCNRASHYIFALWFVLLLLSSFFPRLISAAADWMSAILPHMVWP